jgi:hypothetical protein
MKTFILKQTYITFLLPGRDIYRINEFVDEHGKSYFSYGDLDITCENSMRYYGGPYSTGEPEIKRLLPKATNLLQAQASIIEKMIKEGCENRLTIWVDGTYPDALMRDLGKENLPLLLNFFENPFAIKAFEKVLGE